MLVHTTKSTKNAFQDDLKGVFAMLPAQLRLLLCLSIIVCVGKTAGAQYFEFDAELTDIYTSITQLELESAELAIRSYKESHPQNYLVYHIENYIDFFRCFIDEDYQYFSSIKDRKEDRLESIQQGDKNSPYHKFSQAEVLLQWALVRLKFEEYATALLEMNRAIRLLEENDKLFPEFIANKKSLSALHALVGTIPDTYKSVLSWVSSFNGTIEQGYQEIQQVHADMDADFPFRREVIAIKALIELHVMNSPELAYNSAQHSALNSSTNPLLCFIVANIAHNAGRNDEAIEILESYKPSTTAHPLYYLDYLKGIYKLNRLDPDSDRYIRRYLNYFQGRHYIKEAYQKLAWYAWVIEGDSVEYRRNMEYCIIRGEDLIDEDKQAQNLAREKVLPNRALLQARLLSDGAYLDEALLLLNDIDISNLSSEQAIEYNYRKARVLHDLQKYSDAILNYKYCLSFPYNKEQYYQIAAHLYLGQLYESQGQSDAAIYHYKACLASESSQYEDSLHQKAKVGLLRIDTK